MHILTIDVPVLPDRMVDLTSKLVQIEAAQQHQFPGTRQRYVMIEGEQVTILLVWKSTELAEETLYRDLEAFQADTDMLDCSTAHHTHQEAQAYTA